MKILTNGVFRAVLALVTVLSVIAYAFIVSFGNIPTENRDFVHFILGILVGGTLPSIIGFYYGNTDKTNSAPTDNHQTPKNN